MLDRPARACLQPSSHPTIHHNRIRICIGRARRCSWPRRTGRRRWRGSCRGHRGSRRRRCCCRGSRARRRRQWYLLFSIVGWQGRGGGREWGSYLTWSVQQQQHWRRRRRQSDPLERGQAGRAGLCLLFKLTGHWKGWTNDPPPTPPQSHPTRPQKKQKKDWRGAGALLPDGHPPLPPPAHGRRGGRAGGVPLARVQRRAAQGLWCVRACVRGVQEWAWDAFWRSMK